MIIAWVLDVRRQCMNRGVPLRFHQTGAYFIKDGRTYRIPRRFQAAQARKAGIDCKIVDAYPPGFQAKNPLSHSKYMKEESP